MAYLGPDQSLDQPLPAAVLAQKGLAAKAGEGMSMAGSVEYRLQVLRCRMAIVFMGTMTIKLGYEIN